MPSTDDIKSDEYVAKLLAEDARNSSIKYSSMGLSALLPQRPTNSAPKPNTRFLQSILRETDSHNAALKKKEELEARIRLRNIRYGKTRTGEAEFLERKKRRQHDADEDPRNHKRRARRSQEKDESNPGRRDGHKHRNLHGRLRDETSSRGEDRRRKDRHRHSSPRDRDMRSRSSSPNRDRHHRGRRYASSDLSNPDRHRSRLHDRGRKHDDPKRKASPSQRQPRSDASPSSFSSSASSDPLESIVGPLPPPKPSPPKTTNPPPLTSRGRGAYRPSSSTIDIHFSSTYDPTLDLHPSSPTSINDKEKEDWDMALEALRDREIWKRKGAERLREAGFGEEEVRRWEEGKGAGEALREKGVEDVRWNGSGEQREWDVGKVVVGQDGDGEGGSVGVGGVKREKKATRKGEVVLEAAWKRKGGGFGREITKALG